MKKYEEKALANLLNNPKYPGVYDNDGYHVLTDGYRAVRLYNDLPSLPHTGKPIDIEKFFNMNNYYGVIELPDRKTLREWIKARKLRRNNPKDEVYRLGEITVSPFFLLDMIEGLPGCTAYRHKRKYGPIYFSAETGDGILCPVARY